MMAGLHMLDSREFRQRHGPKEYVVQAGVLMLKEVLSKLLRIAGVKAFFPASLFLRRHSLIYVLQLIRFSLGSSRTKSPLCAMND